MRHPVDSNIETLRALAVFLLVSFHAIGVTQGAGLGIGYPHPLRLFADGLIDIRMPLFAFISGWVYALRPVPAGGFRRFWHGKVRRLIVPGLIAALSFWLIARFVLPGAAGAEAGLAEVMTLSFIHFWFLQAIFLILVCVGLTEAVMRRPLGPVVLILGAGVLLMLPSVTLSYIKVGSFLYLAPFVLLGMLFQRQMGWIRHHLAAVTVVALAAAAVGITMNLDVLAQKDHFSFARRDLQSALLAFGALTLLALYMPRIRVLAAFGPLAFTIYLYHVFGTSGMRRAAQLAGIEHVWLLYGLTVVAGVCVPIAMHLVLARFKVPRQLILGLRPEVAKPVAPVAATTGAHPAIERPA